MSNSCSPVWLFIFSRENTTQRKVFDMAKKYTEPDELIGYLMRKDRKVLDRMKLGDELAVVMDNGVFIIEMEELTDARAGIVVKKLHSIQVDGIIKFSGKG